MRAQLVLSICCCIAGAASAQERSPAPRPASTRDAIDSVTPTPEMWFYKQEMRRYDSPKETVRRKSQFRAAQRQQRIESRKWFGMSNARPVVSSGPQYGTYAPAWTGPGADPNRFPVGGTTHVVIHPREPVYRAATSPEPGIGRK